jgi:hypothetical protein
MFQIRVNDDAFVGVWLQLLLHQGDMIEMRFVYISIYFLFT